MKNKNDDYVDTTTQAQRDTEVEAILKHVAEHAEYCRMRVIAPNYISVFRLPVMQTLDRAICDVLKLVEVEADKRNIQIEQFE